MRNLFRRTNQLSDRHRTLNVASHTTVQIYPDAPQKPRADAGSPCVSPLSGNKLSISTQEALSVAPLGLVAWLAALANGRTTEVSDGDEPLLTSQYTLS